MFYLEILMAKAKYGRTYLKLSDTSRDSLLKHFPPKFSKVFAEHITLEYGLLSETDYQFSSVSVIGYQCTSYLEVLVVAIDGNYTRHFDKGILHITLSAEPGISPVCSNYVLNAKHYEPHQPELVLDVEFQTKLFNF